jgi:Spore germination protein.
MKSDSTSRISARQLVILLVCSRTVSVLTSSAFSMAAGARDTVLGLLISVGAVLLASRIPLRCAITNPVVKTVAKAALAVYFLITGTTSLLSFSVFFQTESEVVFPVVAIVALMMLAVLYALTKGIEGIARFAFIGAVIFVSVMGFMVMANGTRMDITNLAYSSTDWRMGVHNAFADNTLLCPEIPAYFVLKRFVRHQDAHKYSFALFYSVQALVTGLFTVAQELVFGTLASIQSYPVYSLAVVGEISIFQRLDVLHLAVWCIMSLIKVSVLAAACAVLLRDMLPCRKYLNTGICCAVALGTLVFPALFSAKPKLPDWIAMGLFVLVIILLTVSCGKSIREKTAGQKETM